jgi:signal transduction histidine kinase
MADPLESSMEPRDAEAVVDPGVVGRIASGVTGFRRHLRLATALEALHAAVERARTRARPLEEILLDFARIVTDGSTATCEIRPLDDIGEAIVHPRPRLERAGQRIVHPIVVAGGPRWELICNFAEGEVGELEQIIVQEAARRAGVAIELRERAEHAERSRALFEAEPDGLVVHRPLRDAHGVVQDFLCVDMNRAAAQLLGLERPTTGWRYLERFPEAEGRDLIANAAAVLETGIVHEGESDFEGRNLRGSWRATFSRAGDLLVVRFREVSEAKRREARERFLADAAQAFASSLEPEHLIDDLAQFAVPALADWCVVDLIEGEKIRRAAVAHPPNADRELARTWWERFPAPPNSWLHDLVARRASTGIVALDDPAVLAQIDPARREIIVALGLRESVSVSIATRDGGFGVMTLLMASERRFLPDDLRIAQELGDRLAIALENAALFAAERRGRLRLERLHEAAIALGAVSRADVSTLVCRLGSQAAEARAATIWLLEDDALVVAATHGVPEEVVGPWRRIPLERLPAGMSAAIGGQPIWAEDESGYRAANAEAADQAARANRLRPFALLPLSVGDRVLGVIALGFDAWRPFPPDERAFLETLARHCGQALDRAALIESERALRTIAEAAARREAAANRAKDEFLAVTSHELRTPLTAIKAWASLLERRGADPEERRRGLEAIRRNVDLQTKIVDDVLDVALIASGRLPLTRSRVDLRDALTEAVATTRPLADRKKISIAIESTADPLHVDGDPERLRQVVAELVENALKFSPEAQEVRLTLERTGDRARISVVDRGEGFDPEVASTLFERFRQGDASSTRRHGGLGLGLAIVHHLVDAHGGSIEARSAGRGAGSAFVVDLPLAT